MSTVDEHGGQPQQRLAGEGCRPEVNIRAATAPDAAAIAKVHVDSWRTTYRGLVPDAYLAKLSYERRTAIWTRLLNGRASNECIFVAEDASGQIVGFAAGGPERTSDPVYTGELSGIYLLQTHQRQGIGRRLVSAVVKCLAQEGMQSLLVWVLADNPSRQFYEALGGQAVRTKQITIGRVVLDEVAYSWPETSALE